MSRTGILLSGGMDSIAVAYLTKPVIAITVDYGQVSAAGEMRAASAVADALGIQHETITTDLRALGSGNMANAPPNDVAPVPEWWPFRNQLIVTLAAMRGIQLGITRVLLGTVKGDDVHADGRPDFVSALGAVLRLQEGGITLEAPAIHWTTQELIRAAGVPWELLAWAHSCHVSEYACGVCRGCYKHFRTCEAMGAYPY